MIRRLFHSEIRSLSTAAMIIAAASLVSRIVGVLRDRILAGEFGAGELLDIYYAAFRIPDVLFSLLVLGALSAGFIPLFTKLHQRAGEDRGWQFANEVLTFFILLFVAVSVVLFFAAPWIVRLITPGFDADAQRMTTTLTRMMLLSPLFLGVSSVFTGILHSFRRFFVTAIAPIFYNVGIILGALYLVPRFGLSGLAIGVVGGALLHAIIQFPTVMHLGFRYRFRLVWNHSLKSLLQLMVPRTITLGLGHVVLIVMTAFASELQKGSLAVFNFANNLQSFPIGVFGVSYAIAAFPNMSAAVAERDTHGFVRHFSSSVRQVLFFLIPATIVFVVLKAQIVRVILGTGAFDWEDTVLTFRTLEAFSIGLAAQAVLFVIIRAFWAYEDTLRPALVAGVSTGVTITLGVLFRESLGVRGLALAIAIGAIIHVAVLWWLLHRKIGALDGKRIAISVGRMLVAAVVMGVVIQMAKVEVEPFSGTQTFLGIFAQGALAALLGLFVYCALLWFMGSEEVRLFFTSMQRKMGLAQREQMELFDEL